MQAVKHYFILKSLNIQGNYHGDGYYLPLQITSAISSKCFRDSK